MTQINNMNALQSSCDSELQTFFYQEKNVRTVMIDGEPWWVLKDVCDVLEIKNNRDVAVRLDDDEKADVDLIDISSNGTKQRRKITVISESGLYKVILRSDKPESKKFMNWITREVLPSIRRHGAYFTASKAEEILNDPDVLIQLLHTLKEERSEKERLQAKVENDKPKIVFADAVSVSNTSISIADLAKILKGNGVEIGQKRLFERLRNEGFLIRREGSDRNSPTQRSMQLGLFRIKETAITRSDGRITISKTSKVTGKGQEYFVSYFISKKEVENAD